jgi:hypothetical protein
MFSPQWNSKDISYRHRGWNRTFILTSKTTGAQIKATLRCREIGVRPNRAVYHFHEDCDHSARICYEEPRIYVHLPDMVSSVASD